MRKRLKMNTPNNSLRKVFGIFTVILTCTLSVQAQNWNQLGNDIDGKAEDESGTSVSLNSAGNAVAIGARENNGNGYSSGHVRIYDWNGSTWIQRGSDIDGEAADDESGWSVSLNSTGDIVAIGAPGNRGTGRYAGHVRIFEWNGNAWIQIGSDIDGEAEGDISGWSVSLNSLGDIVAIGAPLNDNNGGESGHVRVFYTENISTDILVDEQKFFSVYPNPTNSMLIIESGGVSDQYNIDITSINGQLIFSKEMAGSSHQLDLSTLEKGVYFITIKSKSLVATKKIIKL